MPRKPTRTVPIERLHELFELRGGALYARTQGHYRWPAGRRVGSVGRGGYRSVAVDGVSFYEHRVVYAMVHGVWPDTQIDHRNQNKEDNRPCNLRPAGAGNNAHNTGLRPDNRSGCRNVSWDAARGKWVVVVRCRSKTLHFGRHDDLEFADLVAQEARRKLFGAFAPALS